VRPNGAAAQPHPAAGGRNPPRRSRRPVGLWLRPALAPFRRLTCPINCIQLYRIREPFEVHLAMPSEREWLSDTNPLFSPSVLILARR